MAKARDGDPGAFRALAIEDLPPHVAIEGRIVPLRQTNPATEVEQDPLPQVIGTDWAWTMMWDTNDPRLDGIDQSDQTYHESLAGSSVAGSVRSGIGRLSTDGGSWTYGSHGFSKPGESDFHSNHDVLDLTGEGGHDGLSAMLLMGPVPGSHWELEGVMSPGPLPEPPTSVDPSEAGSRRAIRSVSLPRRHGGPCARRAAAGVSRSRARSRS